jgi:hypothetical protein
LRTQLLQLRRLAEGRFLGLDPEHGIAAEDLMASQLPVGVPHHQGVVQLTLVYHLLSLVRRPNEQCRSTANASPRLSAVL